MFNKIPSRTGIVKPPPKNWTHKNPIARNLLSKKHDINPQTLDIVHTNMAKFNALGSVYPPMELKM